MLKFDHIAIACSQLDQGVSWVETALGVEMETGGKHAYFGTHNALLGLGPDAYLEVIAIDPDSPYTGSRWFDLNAFSGSPRLVAWICSVPDMDQALATYPFAGPAHDLQRGDLTWRFACPDTGGLLMGGAFPYLIEWGQGVPHPSSRLRDQGLRLDRLDITHPDADQLPVQPEGGVEVRYHAGADISLQAHIRLAEGRLATL